MIWSPQQSSLSCLLLGPRRHSRWLRMAKVSLVFFHHRYSQWWTIVSPPRCVCLLSISPSSKMPLSEESQNSQLGVEKQRWSRVSGLPAGGFCRNPKRDMTFTKSKPRRLLKSHKPLSQPVSCLVCKAVVLFLWNRKPEKHGMNKQYSYFKMLMNIDVSSQNGKSDNLVKMVQVQPIKQSTIPFTKQLNIKFEINFRAYFPFRVLLLILKYCFSNESMTNYACQSWS